MSHEPQKCGSIIEEFIKWAKSEGRKIRVSKIWDLSGWRHMIILDDEEKYIDNRDGIFISDSKFVKATGEFIGFGDNVFDVQLESLESGETIYCLYEAFYEDLKWHPDGAFTLLVPLSKLWVAVKGRWIENTVCYWIDKPIVEDLSEKEVDEVREWLRNNRLKVWRLLLKYHWRPVDLWRGYHHNPENVFEGWVKVIEGWVGLGCGDPMIEKLSRIKELHEEPPVKCPILFVFPTCSNICVAYFDVYVKKGFEREFIKAVIQKREEFDLNRGIYYTVLV